MLNKTFVLNSVCDTPNLWVPLTTHQPAEFLWILGDPIPHCCVLFIRIHIFIKIGQNLLCSGSSTQHTTCDESFGGLIGEVTVHNPLNVPDGPITRSRAKKIKEAMARLVQSTWAEFGHPVNKTSTFKMGFNKEGVALINLIQATKELG